MRRTQLAVKKIDKSLCMTSFTYCTCIVVICYTEKRLGPIIVYIVCGSFFFDGRYIAAVAVYML